MHNINQLGQANSCPARRDNGEIFSQLFYGILSKPTNPHYITTSHFAVLLLKFLQNFNKRAETNAHLPLSVVFFRVFKVVNRPCDITTH